MMGILQVASYIYKRYMDDFGVRIDEMKLHKLLYFTQRECLIQKGEPMFDAQFEAWKYGPEIFLSFMIFFLQAFLFTNTLDAVPNDQYRVAEQHARPGIPHNSTDLFPHGGLIAMHPAVGAKGLCFDKRAAVGAQQRVLLQGLTFRTKPLPCAVVPPAVGAYHQ